MYNNSTNSVTQDLDAISIRALDMLQNTTALHAYSDIKTQPLQNLTLSQTASAHLVNCPPSPSYLEHPIGQQGGTRDSSHLMTNDIGLPMRVGTMPPAAATLAELRRLGAFKTTCATGGWRQCGALPGKMQCRALNGKMQRRKESHAK